jgi:hypothetical protein
LGFGTTGQRVDLRSVNRFLGLPPPNELVQNLPVTVRDVDRLLLSVSELS